jgi:hypothetical protein
LNSKIKYVVVDKDTLRLEEKGEVGDLIDLKEKVNVDTSSIVEQIKIQENEEYQKLLAKSKKEWEEEKNKSLKEQELLLVEKNKTILNNLQNEKINLETKVENLKKESSQNLITEMAKLDLQKANEINKVRDDLQKQISELNQFKAKAEAEKEAAVEKVTGSYLLEKTKLENQLEIKQNEINSLKDGTEKEIAAAVSKKEIELIGYKEKLIAKEAELTTLTREKSVLNIKEIGENLENWCNQQFKTHSTSGFENCTFEKVNKTIHDEKPDYLFTMFADDAHAIPVVKVVCEMKSESLVGNNKKKNADHYDKLDSDRVNHGGQESYALLISELEKDNDNIIEKVQDKEKMFMVRPAYFIPFLSIIYNLGKKYKQVVIKELEFKDKKMILEEFEDMKNEILDNAIKHLSTHATTIKAKVNQIKSICEEIELKSIQTIFTHLTTIENKINDFGIKKIVKKIEKTELIDIDNIEFVI